jgi:hypothetical protein
VLHTIVEGEPGIFPEPVARVMRAIGGLFGHRRPAEPASGSGATPAGDAATPGSDAGSVASPESASGADSGDRDTPTDEPGQADPAR